MSPLLRGVPGGQRNEQSRRADDPNYFASFDLYERYAIASRAIQALRRTSTPSVLDVGGYSEVLYPGFQSLVSAFVPEARSFVVDLHKEPGLSSYATGSVMQLPFRDETFDFVLAQDTLEHVAPESRRQFLHEVLRVSRDIVLLSFPFFTPLNQACDRLIYGFIQTRKRVNLQALKEHLELGLPELATIRAWIEELGLPFQVWTHGNTLTWLYMMTAKNCFWVQGIPDFGKELDYLFNVRFAAGDHDEPCYRCFVLIGRNKSRQRIHSYKDPFRAGQDDSDEGEILRNLCRLLIGAASTHGLEQLSQHSINLLQDLRGQLTDQRLADVETRSAEKGSQTEHVQRLLGEWQEKFADAENRLAEKTSQAQHFQNLAAEYQEKFADAENRLAEKTSQAQHFQNLVAEYQEKFADAENRLAEKTSQAQHFQNLVAEYQEKFADAENRLAEKTSEAGHLHNLLAESREKCADAENRLAQKTSIADHHEKLLEEDRRRLADLEERLREKSTEAARSQEQVQSLKDRMDRLDQQLAQERAARNAAEDELRVLKAKLSRFPARFVIR